MNHFSLVINVHNNTKILLRASLFLVKKNILVVASNVTTQSLSSLQSSGNLGKKRIKKLMRFSIIFSSQRDFVKLCIFRFTKKHPSSTSKIQNSKYPPLLRFEYFPSKKYIRTLRSIILFQKFCWHFLRALI